MEGKRFCRVISDWDYKGRMVNLSILGYISKALTKYQHAIPTHPQYHPYKSNPTQYGAKVQHVLEPYTSATITKYQIKHFQDIFGTLIYHGRAVKTVTALSAISSRQAKVTESVFNACQKLLKYVATHPNADILYHTSDMILAQYTDVSYLSYHGEKRQAAA